MANEIEQASPARSEQPKSRSTDVARDVDVVTTFLIAELYDVLYLADICDERAREAESTDEFELRQFFSELRDSQLARASHVRRLIADRIRLDVSERIAPAKERNNR